MTLSLIVAVVIAPAWYGLIRSRQEEAHHLEDLHVASDTGKGKD